MTKKKTLYIEKKIKTQTLKYKTAFNIYAEIDKFRFYERNGANHDLPKKKKKLELHTNIICRIFRTERFKEKHIISDATTSKYFAFDFLS